MNRGKALAPLSLSNRQKTLLSKYLSGGKISVDQKTRISIILLAERGNSNRATSQALGITEVIVRKWRKRWLSQYEHLCAYESEAVRRDREVLKKMLSFLKDAPRSGSPARISSSEKESLMSLACASPESVGVPVTHWTRELLAKVAMQKGLVKKISPRYVSEILKKTSPTASQE